MENAVPAIELLQKHHCFAGEQRFYCHDADSLKCEMKFGVYMPEKALKGHDCAAVIYLAGLTCTEETFAIKAHAQHVANALDLILIMPDTSPRGEDVMDDAQWDLGQGAGFYVNATQLSWSKHYQMQTYIVEELYRLIIDNFPIATDRDVKPKIGVMGHSMGGHGALSLAFKFPEKFQSVSVFAPICAPSICPWGEKAFSHYLGADQQDWFAHDSTHLIIEHGKQFDEILVDQGLDDQFYSQLNPEKLQQACDQVGQNLTLRFHKGFDHGYYFIQSFIADHLRHHAEQLHGV